MADAAKALNEKLQGYALGGVLSLSIALGIQLNLFEAVGEISSEDHPVTADEVADKAGCKPRYVQEWLSTMACADIFGVTEDGVNFWMPASSKSVLCANPRSPAMQFNMFSHQFGLVFASIANVFRKDGPLGTSYDQYTGFYKEMSDLSKALHGNCLISKFVPATGLQQQLERGIKVLDVGCGNGFHVHMLAEVFPNSRFDGIDNSVDAILSATGTTSTKGLKNVHFAREDAAHLPVTWTGQFDWVTIFDACHDQTRPDLSLKEIHRVLKPGGVFSMLEVKGTSNVYLDKQEDPYGSAFHYGISTFHCLPVGNSTPDALGLGTKWGEVRARQLLEEAGFERIEIVPTPFYEGSSLYQSYKKLDASL